MKWAYTRALCDDPGVTLDDWVADTLQQLQQISLSGVGPITPRTITYSTSGSMLMRTETCPGGDTPDTGYRVFSDGDGRTRLEIGNAALRFEFVRRGG